MRKQCRPWIFILIQLLTLFNLLCYFSIRPLWPGIGIQSMEPLPLILLAVIVFCSLTMTILTFNRSYPVLIAVPVFIIDILFLVVDSYIISLLLYATPYFIREFLYGARFLGVVGAVWLLITRLPKLPVFQKKWFPSVLLLVVLAAGILIQSDFPFFNTINCTPVVYAVEDTYQIVFTSRVRGTGWVTIDGVEYNDTSAGYRKSESTVHKISVPMAALDNTGEYTVSTRSMLLRGPFGVYQGETISKTCRWRGVIPEDGLDYYVISDTHNTQKTPYEAASYFGDSLDFLICCGDIASWIDREEDLTQLLYLAGNITGGSVPVIYARGNHDTKGERAYELSRYVSADGEDFYYTFRLKNIWGIVLDIGEDHGDKYDDYSGTAKFNAYRRAQTSFLDDVLENAETEFDAPGVDYRIAVCHIPLTVKYTNDHAASYKDAWLTRLNKMKLTVLFGGHVHQLWYIDNAFEAGSTLTLSPHYSGTADNTASRIMTNADFPAILVSRQSEGQLLTCPEKAFDTAFIGLAVTSDGETTVMKYTNEKHEVLENIVSPWFEEIEYGSEIIIENVK